MAAATGITALAGMGGGIAKFFEGSAMQRDAQDYINKFKWQDLQNPMANLQVSTLGADLQKEQQNLASSQDIAALQQGGTRALVGGLGRVEAQRNLTNRTLASNLDEQQKAINMAKAQQDVANQNMIEQRQANELQGYGQMLSTGFGTKYQGINDIANAFGAAGQAYQGFDRTRLPQESVGDITSQGMTPLGGITPQTPTLYPQYVDKSTLPAWAQNL